MGGRAFGGVDIATSALPAVRKEPLSQLLQNAIQIRIGHIAIKLIPVGLERFDQLFH